MVQCRCPSGKVDFKLSIERMVAMKTCRSLIAVAAVFGVAAVQAALSEIHSGTAEVSVAQMFGLALDPEDNTNGGFWTIARSPQTVGFSTATASMVTIASRSVGESDSQAIYSTKPGMTLIVP